MSTEFTVTKELMASLVAEETDKAMSALVSRSIAQARADIVAMLGDQFELTVKRHIDSGVDVGLRHTIARAVEEAVLGRLEAMRRVN